MRLGGRVWAKDLTPGPWAEAVRASGYRAAYCPVGPDADDATVRAYAEAARDADIVIAEVGAWSNPLSADSAARAAAVDKCKKGLALAEHISARCCVNIAGSRGVKWDGPDARDLTEETFQMIVESVRDIIDSVRPARAFYTLETMPWMYPDSVESYARLIRAIDRKAFAVHLDPVNLVNCPQRYFENATLIRECVARLGPSIRSCHAKDIVLATNLTVHLSEARPGTGGLDYRVLLRELNRLDADLPLMLEHLPNEEEYRLAAQYVRSVAEKEGIAL